MVDLLDGGCFILVLPAERVVFSSGVCCGAGENPQKSRLGGRSTFGRSS